MKLNDVNDRINLWQNPRFKGKHICNYIPWFFQRLKYTFQRAKYGYCILDIKMCDEYISLVLSNVLRAYSKVATHAPSEYLSFTKEDMLEPWREHLQELSSLFYAYVHKKNNRESEVKLKAYRNHYAKRKAESPNAGCSDLMQLYPEIKELRNVWSNQLMKENRELNDYVATGLIELERIFRSLN